MTKIVFSSMVAAAILFTGCGGGGGGDTTTETTTGAGGGATTGAGGGAATGAGGGAATGAGGTAQATLPKFTYGKDVLNPNTITINQLTGKWTVRGVTLELGVKSTKEMTYTEAVKYCRDNNGTIPSANDLLTFNKDQYGLSAAWTKGQFVVYPGAGMIGQDAASSKYYVQCLTNKSGTIEKKHSVKVNADKSVTDLTTGLTWSAFQVINKGDTNGSTNQFTFPILNPATGLLSADQYCRSLPGGPWQVPTLSELRSIMFLDSTTQVQKLDGLSPTVIWTDSKVPGSTKNYAINLNRNSIHSAEDGNARGQVPDKSNAYHYVTCVKQ